MPLSYNCKNWIEQVQAPSTINWLALVHSITGITDVRSSSALQATFSIPTVLARHLDVRPKHGVVQANDYLAAQVKFVPLRSILSEECQNYVNGEGVMEIPVSIVVAGQVGGKL